LIINCPAWSERALFNDARVVCSACDGVRSPRGISLERGWLCRRHQDKIHFFTKLMSRVPRTNLLNLMLRFPILLMTVVFLATGCLSRVSKPALDVRAALLASAGKSDPDFPEGREMVLTHFSHVGQLVTSSGEIIYVGDRRAVIAGMLAPRGQNCITFFDSQFRYLGKIGYVASRPLWCDGSRLYLFGELDGFATGLSGNVIDVADGYQHLRAYHANVYGSGGDAEEPNDVAALPVHYRNVKCDFTFSLPAGWHGYSVLIQEWEGQTYLRRTDSLAVTERGPLIVLRHPQWKEKSRRQDIPILVFTRSQWRAREQGKFTTDTGGFDEEIGHNRNYVFAVSSRFNADDSVDGWNEARETVERNQALNGPQLYPR
jgi:hypothetical protein